MPCCDGECCIISSCQRKFTNPQFCEHKPKLQSKQNISKNIVNAGRKQIMITESFKQRSRMDHAVMLGLVKDRDDSSLASW